MEVIKVEKSYSFQRHGTVTTTTDLPVNWVCSLDVFDQQMELKLSVDPSNSQEDFKNSRTFVKFLTKQGPGAPKTLMFAFLDKADENTFLFDWVGVQNPTISLAIIGYKPKLEGARFPRGFGIMDPKTSKYNLNFSKDVLEFDFSSESIPHDRILDLGGQKFHVQSGYLIMWSDYFNTLFTGEFSEANQKEIKIDDVLPNEFEIFLKFIYPCQLDITADNCIVLISLAHRFMAPRVLEKCQEFISLNFDGMDKLELLELAFKFNIQEIKDEVAAYIESNAVSKAKNEYLLDRNSFVISNRERIAELPDEVQSFIFQSVLNSVKLV